MSLDEALRRRLRALAEHEQLAALDEQQRAHVAQRARQRRAAQAGQGWRAPLLLAAAGVPLLLWLLASRTEPGPSAALSPELSPRIVEPAAPSQARPASASVPGPTPVAAASCEARSSLAFARASMSELRLDLGTRALLVAKPGARVTAALSGECDLRAELADGSLAVHARQLQGAALIVATPRGEVRVRGTVFQVSFAAGAGELRVGVEEGRVQVETHTGQMVELAPGQAVRVAAQLTHEAFTSSARAQLRRTLGLSAQAQAAKSEPPSPLDAKPAVAVPQGEPVRAWHTGGVEAPAQAPELGSSVTDEGRPMSKPKVTLDASDLSPKPAPAGESP